MTSGRSLESAGKVFIASELAITGCRKAYSECGMAYNNKNYGCFNSEKASSALARAESVCGHRPRIVKPSLSTSGSLLVGSRSTYLGWWLLGESGSVHVTVGSLQT